MGLLAAALASSALADSEFRAVFEAVWMEVAQSYYDSSFVDNEWKALGDRYRGRLESVEDRQAFESLMTEMLRELGESHFSMVTHSINELMPNSWSGGDSGMAFTVVGNRPIVLRVKEGSPAALAGIAPGFELTRIGDSSVKSLYSLVQDIDVGENTIPYYFLAAVENRFYGPPGKPVEFRMNAGGIGRAQSFSVKLDEYAGLMSVPMGNMGEVPIELETRILDSNVAYLRFNLWVPSIMEDIRGFIKSLDGRAAGLIIDIRGNPGGIGLMATGLAGMLVDEEYRMGTMRLREGHLNFNVYPQKGAFLGPLAVLTDSNSISTSEIFAADVKETGRGRIFGTKTPGAALPSVFKKLPNQYLLQMVIADYVTEGGKRIERSGVRPDVRVVLSPSQLRKGRDNVVDAAQKWILRQN